MTDVVISSPIIIKKTRTPREPEAVTFASVVRSIKIFLFGGITSKFGWVAMSPRYNNRVQFLALTYDGAARKADRIGRRKGWPGARHTRGYIL